MFASFPLFSACEQALKLLLHSQLLLKLGKTRGWALGQFGSGQRSSSFIASRPQAPEDIQALRCEERSRVGQKGAEQRCHCWGRCCGHACVAAPGKGWQCLCCSGQRGRQPGFSKGSGAGDCPAGTGVLQRELRPA